MQDSNRLKPEGVPSKESLLQVTIDSNQDLREQQYID